MRKTIFKWEYIVNGVAILLGLLFIVLSVVIVTQDGTACHKALQIIGDVGVGLFPTGIIGLLICIMQEKDKERHRLVMRKEILRLINSAVHQYLLEICKCAACKCGNLKGKKLTEIERAIINRDVNFPYSDTEVEKLKVLTLRLTDYFGKAEPALIIGDLFTSNEQKFYAARIEEGQAIIESYSEAKNSEEIAANKRNDYITHWQSLRGLFPEYRKYNNLYFDGHNLVIK